jgi:hypothetical protein
MVDAAGTTAYSYTAGGSLQSEDGPWANDTVSYTYHATVHGLRTGLSIQQPAASFAVTNVYDAAKRLTNVALNSVRSGMLKENPEPQKSPKLKLRRSGMVRGRCPGSAPRWLQHGVRRRRRAGLQDWVDPVATRRGCARNTCMPSEGVAGEPAGISLATSSTTSSSASEEAGV